MFLREKLFLQLIAYSEDKKQKFQIIKCINHNQYFELKKIAINILQGVLPLKKDQLKYLKNSKTLIRKLAEGKVTNNYLATHYMIISYIVKIALEYNEKHTKTCTGSNRKVGKNQAYVKVCPWCGVGLLRLSFLCCGVINKLTLLLVSAAPVKRKGARGEVRFPETLLLCALFYLKGPAPCCYWFAVTCLSYVVCLSLKAVLSRLVTVLVIVVRVRHCLSLLVYAGLSMFTCCRALLISGCTRLPMRITLHGGA